MASASCINIATYKQRLTLLTRRLGECGLLYMAAGSIAGANLPSCRVNKNLFTRHPGANNIYLIGSDKLHITFIQPEVQLYMSTSYQPGSSVMRVFSDTEKLFFIFGFGGFNCQMRKYKMQFNVREGLD